MALLEWGTQEKVLTQRGEERGWRRGVRGLRGQVKGCMLGLWVGAVTVDRGGQRYYLEGRAGSLPPWFWPLSSLLPREKRKGCSDPVPQPKGQRVGRAGGRREWNKSGAAEERDWVKGHRDSQQG